MPVSASSTDTRGAVNIYSAAAILWGLGGITWLLLGAIRSLLTPALEAFRSPDLTTPQLVFGLFWLVFMGYSEGYRGFQKGYSPRVVVRAMHLARHPNLLHLLLAPAFCMALFHASKRRLITSWAVVGGVSILIVVVRNLPFPWRGLVDGGVVLGLGWGLAAIGIYAIMALMNRPLPAEPQLPEHNEPAS